MVISQGQIIGHADKIKLILKFLLQDFFVLNSRVKPKIYYF